MNYSRHTTKKTVGERILISWLIIAAMFLVIGFGCGWGVKAVTSPQNSPKSAAGTYIADAPTYGAFAGFTPHTWENWERDGFKFIPLDIDLDPDIQEFTFYLCGAYQIDYAFVLALMDKESRFQIDVISRTNDYGLMQINGRNAEYLNQQAGIGDLLDPYENIKGGLFILRDLFDKYDDSASVLMAYNMGEGGAAKLWRGGVYETLYTQDVFQLQEKYIELLTAAETAERNG